MNNWTQSIPPNDHVTSRWSPLLLALFVLVPCTSVSSARQTFNTETRPLLILRGRVSCVNGAAKQESGKQLGSAPDCSGPGEHYEIETPAVRAYSFSSTDTMTAMFSDPRIRERELQVTARANTLNELEIIKVRTIRDGKLYDVFYFCDVCNITAYAPGPCACCRRDYELKETPAQISDLRLRDPDSVRDHPSPQP